MKTIAQAQLQWRMRGVLQIQNGYEPGLRRMMRSSAAAGLPRPSRLLAQM